MGPATPWPRSLTDLRSFLVVVVVFATFHLHHVLLLHHHHLLSLLHHYLLLLHHGSLPHHGLLLHHLLLLRHLHLLLLHHRVRLQRGRVNGLVHRGHWSTPGNDSLRDNCLLSHHILLPHLIHLHLHLHLSLSHGHHLHLVRVAHRAHLAHSDRHAHSLHHELLVLHRLHHVHLALLLHHVVHLHLLADHLLALELLLHRKLLLHHVGAWVECLLVCLLTHVRLLNKVLHDFSTVSVLNNLELPSEKLCLLLAFLALGLKACNLRLQEPNLSILGSQRVSGIIVIHELEGLALISDSLFLNLILLKALLPERLDLFPERRAQTDECDAANYVGNNHHIALNIIKVDILHFFQLLFSCFLCSIICLLSRFLSLFICFLSLLLSLIFVFFEILRCCAIFYIVLKLFHELILLNFEPNGDILKENESCGGLDNHDEGHEVRKENTEGTREHFGRFVTAKQHVLLRPVVQERAHEADWDGDGNDWSVEEARGNQDEVL